ncbi:MAG: hypothetical protein WDA16_02075 [Candidatus Thermoplasmatota archaeon]
MARGLPAWAYVDERRTHDVRAGVKKGPPLAFVVRERAFDSDDPAEAWEASHVLSEPWEWRAHQTALEMRLSLLGRYYRMTAGQQGWFPVGAPPQGRSLDLSPICLEDDSPLGKQSRFEFHHYAQPGERHAVTLTGVPQGEDRMALTRLDYEFPDVAGGNLRVLHAKLPIAVYRSMLAAQHIELGELGIRKVSRDEGSMAGDPRWWAAMQACLDALLGRLSEGKTGKPGEPPTSRDASVAATINRIELCTMQKRLRGAAVRARRFETEDEIGQEHACPVEGRRIEVLLDDVSPDVLATLREPRLRSLVHRFLPAGDDERLIRENERAIRDYMKRKRAATRPDVQHLLSIVEASLLVRHALSRRGARLDQETIDTLKHAPAYL